MMRRLLARSYGLSALELTWRAHLSSPVSTRSASSLSAIHDGLRRSEKARPQGFTKSSLESSGRGRTSTRRSSPVRNADDYSPTSFKILKGKKDITLAPKPKPMTRAARFNDPNSSFGKKSLVYRLKARQPRDETPAQLETTKTASFAPDTWDSLEQASADQGTRRRDQQFSRRDRPSRPQAPRQSERARRPEDRPRNSDNGRERTENRSWTPRLSDGRTRGEARPGAHDIGRSYGGDWIDPTATVMPYTTAASQFLYGRSVVEEALRSSRRKLYHLYIYDGPNRSHHPNDAGIERLAQRKGVKISRLGEEHQRLMSRMSEGRPHNNFVLEASAVPQPPVEALGPISGEGEARAGFQVVLGHQSAEDLDINGSSDFVETEVRNHKPLVLLLDRILDPGNLGNILRTASFLGVSAAVISQRNSATLTPVALKAAAGASETLPLFACDNPAGFLHRSRESGWKVFAAVAPSRSKKTNEQDLYEIEDLDPLATDPCILVVGSEGEGLPSMIKNKSHHTVTIPNSSGAHTIDSLNVSVATGLLCGAFMKGAVREKIPVSASGASKSNEMGFW